MIAVIAALHLSALQFYLYWRLWWFDILTHFLGGFWVSMSFLWLFFQFGFANIMKNGKNNNLKVALLSSFAVGIAWEVFEYYFGITFIGAPGYAFDTVKDISFDIIGGFAAYRFFVFKGYHKRAVGGEANKWQN